MLLLQLKREHVGYHAKEVACWKIVKEELGELFNYKDALRMIRINEM